MSEQNIDGSCSLDWNQDKFVMFDYQSVLKKAEQCTDHLQTALLEQEDLSDLSLSLYDEVLSEASAPELPSFHCASSATSELAKQMKELQHTIDTIEASYGHKQKKKEDLTHQKRLKGQKEWKKMTQPLAQEPDVNSVNYLLQEVERFKVRQQIRPKQQPAFASPNKKKPTSITKYNDGISENEVPAYFRYGNAYAIFHPFTDSDAARIHAIDHPYDRYLKQQGYLFGTVFCTSLIIGAISTVIAHVFSDHSSTQIAIAYLYHHTLALVIIIIMIIYITLGIHTGCYLVSVHDLARTKKHRIIGSLFRFTLGCVAEVPFVIYALIKNYQEN